MDLLKELNKYRHLKWGDPDNHDEDAHVHLCAMAADRIAALEAELAEARVASNRLAASLSFCNDDMADLEAELAEARVSAWLDTKIEWYKNMKRNDYGDGVLGAFRECRAAIDDAGSDK